jgi:PKHD-type hydroxylase
MWPSIVTIDNFLDKDDLAIIQQTIAAGQFVDGNASASGQNLEVKNNQEMAPQQPYVEAVKLVERSVKTNMTLNYTAFPKAITRAVISKYEKGMSYGVHIDSPVMGFMVQSQALGPFGQNYVRSDFSMTIFLNKPDSYDGGELSFESPWGPQNYKLDAGSAVVYPTGLPHQVMPVSFGARFAAVLWLQSMIRDQEQRRLVSDINRLARQLMDANPKSPEALLAIDIAATALRISADV